MAFSGNSSSNGGVRAPIGLIGATSCFHEKRFAIGYLIWRGAVGREVRNLGKDPTQQHQHNPSGI
jgi:hypothetical protein